MLKRKRGSFLVIGVRRDGPGYAVARGLCLSLSSSSKPPSTVRVAASFDRLRGDARAGEAAKSINDEVSALLMTADNNAVKGVRCDAYSFSGKTLEDCLMEFDIVVASDLSQHDYVLADEICRSAKITFACIDVLGLAGRAFFDVPSDGNPTSSAAAPDGGSCEASILDISRSGEVSIDPDAGIQIKQGDFVRFDALKRGAALNGAVAVVEDVITANGDFCLFRVNPRSKALRGVRLDKCQGGVIELHPASAMAQPRSLIESIIEPSHLDAERASMWPPPSRKIKSRNRSAHLHAAFQGVAAFRERVRDLPGLGDKADARRVVALSREFLSLNAQLAKEGSVCLLLDPQALDERLASMVAYYAQKPHRVVCDALAKVVVRELLEPTGVPFQPREQFIYFDVLHLAESMVDDDGSIGGGLRLPDPVRVLPPPPNTHTSAGDDGMLDAMELCAASEEEKHQLLAFLWGDEFK